MLGSRLNYLQYQKSQMCGTDDLKFGVEYELLLQYNCVSNKETRLLHKKFFECSVFMNYNSKSK